MRILSETCGTGDAGFVENLWVGRTLATNSSAPTGNPGTAASGRPLRFVVSEFG